MGCKSRGGRTKLRTKGPRAGEWILERGSELHPHQLGSLGERCRPKLPHSAFLEEPRKYKI